MVEYHDDNLGFEDFFNERVRDRGLSLKKLSEITGITTKHLEAISRGNFSKLPPAPYLHGYIKRLGEVLDFDYERWWEKLKMGGFVQYSGASDEFPKNRFIKKLKPRIVWVAIAVVVVVVYFGFQFTRILGKPTITVIFPDQNPATAVTAELSLRGTLENANNLSINGEVIMVGEDGSWEKKVLLEPGLNSLEISATKFLGRETKIIQQILYQPTSTATF